MLPCATQQRTTRESSQVQKNSRGVEISRLIGRALRATVNLEKLGERSIIIDCDVLQADGGTRVACITAASLALECAIHRWVEAGILEENIFKEHIAAISVGIVNGISHVDLSYIEDSQADADFNIVITKSEKLIEIQGTSERTPVSWEQFEIIKNLALDSLRKIFDLCLLESKKNLEKREKKLLYSIQQNTSSMGPINKTPFFSLSNRISK
jgi:ribonuclease PH